MFVHIFRSSPKQRTIPLNTDLEIVQSSFNGIFWFCSFIILLLYSFVSSASHLQTFIINVDFFFYFVTVEPNLYVQNFTDKRLQMEMLQVAFPTVSTKASDRTQEEEQTGVVRRDRTTQGKLSPNMFVILSHWWWGLTWALLDWFLHMHWGRLWPNTKTTTITY